jgi:methyl-accepting chemotaxis protein
VAAGRNLTVYLTSDVSKFRRGLNKGEQELRGFNKTVQRVGTAAVKGFAIAGAAAGALAVKMGIDAVKGAIEERAALDQLHKTVKNLGFEAATSSLDAFVDSTARSSTATDDDLRPALAKLLTATKDVTEAQTLLKTSLDLSAFAGVPLATAVNAVAKASTGTYTTLKKLVPGLDSLAVSAPNATAVMQELADVTGGSADTAFASLSGQMGQITDDIGELQDAFGGGFLDALGESDAKAGELSGTLQDLQPTMQELGGTVGETVVAVGQIASAVTGAREAFDGMREDLGPFVAVLDSVTGAIYNMATPLLSIAGAVKGITEAAGIGDAAPHTDPITHLNANPVIPPTNRTPDDPIRITRRTLDADARARARAAKSRTRP